MCPCLSEFMQGNEKKSLGAFIKDVPSSPQNLDLMEPLMGLCVMFSDVGNGIILGASFCIISLAKPVLFEFSKS